MLNQVSVKPLARKTTDGSPDGAPLPSPQARRRLLLVSSHVVQYAAPVFRQIAQDGRIDLLVAYCSMQGSQSGVDPGFGIEVSWDRPLLEGYPWTDVPNRSLQPGVDRFFGLFNPGLWELIRKGNFDAVFVSGYFFASAWIAILAAKWYRVPIIFSTEAHDLRSLRGWANQSKQKFRLKRMRVRQILSLGKVLMAVSSGAVAQLKALGFPEDRIILAPYSVDNDWWVKRATEVDRNAVRGGWQIPVSAFVVLFCAKLQPWKSPMDLLEAFSRANLPNSFLVFAGDGPLRNSVERRARELAILDRIRFLGFVNQTQLPGVYRASDLLVLPSIYEGFGLVVNEAMLCGCPVVVSDRVGAKFDLVRPGENGYIFPMGQVEALAAILIDALADSEKRDRMSVAARKRMETWSPREYANSMFEAVELAARKTDK